MTAMASTSDAAPLTISPAPTDEEAAAIVAAVEAMWPRPTLAVADEGPRSLGWRFSGRWWRRDRHAAADRPWR